MAPGISHTLARELFGDGLQRRQIPASIKQSLPTWDSCMAKTVCKWPVIVAIIAVSCIVLSVLWCLARCICCGAQCVCCCFRCCGSKHKKGHHQLQSAPPTPYNNQYQSHGAPVYGVGPNGFAQTATFEGKVHDDALPAMPSWESAATKRIEVVEPQQSGVVAESHEMERLRGDHETSGSVTPQPRPMPMRNNSSVPSSPRLPPDMYTGGGAPSDSQSGYRGAAPNLGQMGYDRTQTYASQGYGGGGQAAYGGNDSYGAGAGYGGQPNRRDNSSPSYSQQPNRRDNYSPSPAYSQQPNRRDNQSPSYPPQRSPQRSPVNDYGQGGYNQRSNGGGQQQYQTYGGGGGGGGYGGGQSGGGRGGYGQQNGGWRDV